MANLNIRRTEKNKLDNWVIERPRYYDFFLFPDAMLGAVPANDCIETVIDPNHSQVDEDGTIYAYSAWTDAKNTGINLPDWGFCSPDNGYTKIDWEEDDLLEIFTNTSLIIPEEEKRFFMKPIFGNYYCDPPIDYTLYYSVEDNEKVINAQGGGLQGFYKLFLPKDVGEYQTLENRPQRCITYEFMIKPQNVIKENTLSYYYPENSGIFFFQGTRAENKWWYYTRKLNIENLNNIKQALISNGECNLANILDEDELSKAKSIFESMQTSEGLLVNTSNIVEINTNNKFLYMNRTICGYRVSCCHDNKNDEIPEEIILSYQKKNQKLNYYTLFNRTTDKYNRNLGLTVSQLHPVSGISCCSYGFYEIWKRYECSPYLLYNLGDKPMQNLPEGFENIDIYDNEIDIYRDTYNNAMAFRITPTGALGYRINIQNCDEDRDVNPTKLLEEYSLDNIVRFDRWNYIVVKICYDSTIKRPECPNEPPRKGVISFYVNGRLKFSSKNFKEPMFRELNEHWSKQEGVPFNMSLMVGSQGLLETILSDNPLDYDRYVFPIEKFFAGNTIGKLLFFKINNCNLPHIKLQNNFKKLYYLLLK